MDLHAPKTHSSVLYTSEYNPAFWNFFFGGRAGLFSRWVAMGIGAACSLETGPGPSDEQWPSGLVSTELKIET